MLRRAELIHNLEWFQPAQLGFAAMGPIPARLEAAPQLCGVVAHMQISQLRGAEPIGGHQLQSEAVAPTHGGVGQPVDQAQDLCILERSCIRFTRRCQRIASLAGSQRALNWRGVAQMRHTIDGNARSCRPDPPVTSGCTAAAVQSPLAAERQQHGLETSIDEIMTKQRRAALTVVLMLAALVPVASDPVLAYGQDKGDAGASMDRRDGFNQRAAWRDEAAADTNSCVEGSVIGGLLGAGLGAMLSRGNGRWVGVPVGGAAGALIGCQVDGG